MPSSQDIFKSSSTTYYYSSLFFPEKIRNNIFTLYSFVRTADDMVDATPQKITQFLEFYDDTLLAFEGKAVRNEVIADFYHLAQETNISLELVTPFLDSMKEDITKSHYTTFEELEQYMYGSAEVIGLMMAKIMHLKEKSYKSAQALGKAMQLLNFIRDIKEDIVLGRQYIPQEDLEKFGISSLSQIGPSQYMAFGKLIEFEIHRYFHILEEAEKGFRYIPLRYRTSIKTASEMYKWTAKEILKNPLIVLEKKIKPTPRRVMLNLILNLFRL